MNTITFHNTPDNIGTIEQILDLWKQKILENFNKGMVISLHTHHTFTEIYGEIVGDTAHENYDCALDGITVGISMGSYPIKDQK